MTVTKIRNLLGISRAEFSRRYEIPIRTLENWEAGVRQAPEWTVKMLERIVKEDAMKKTLEIVEWYINGIRERHGKEIVTDPVVDGDVIRFTLQPDDEIQGTMFEVRMDGAVRNKGIGKGYFWTEWREGVFTEEDGEYRELDFVE